MRLAMGLAEEAGCDLPLASLTGKLFEEALATFGGAAWSTEAVRLLEKSLGEELRAAGFPEVLPGQESL